MKESRKWKWIGWLSLGFFLAIVSTFVGYVVWTCEKSLSFATALGILCASGFGNLVLGAMFFDLRSAVNCLLPSKPRTADDTKFISEDRVLRELDDELRQGRALQREARELIDPTPTVLSEIDRLAEEVNAWNPENPILDTKNFRGVDAVRALFRDLSDVIRTLAVAGHERRQGKGVLSALRALVKERDDLYTVLEQQFARLGHKVSQASYPQTLINLVDAHLASCDELAEKERQRVAALEHTEAIDRRNNLLVISLKQALALLAGVVERIWISRGVRGKNFTLQFQEAVDLRRQLGQAIVHSLQEIPEDHRDPILLQLNHPSLLSEIVDRSGIPEGDPFIIGLRERIRLLRQAQTTTAPSPTPNDEDLTCQLARQRVDDPDYID